MNMAYGKYSVPKVAEQQMKVPGKQGGNSDVIQKNPPPVGAQRNPASSPDDHFSREFSAEKDLQTLLSAAKIRANKARYGQAIALKDRMVAMNLKNRGGEPLNERGPEGHVTSRGGSPRRASNRYDNVPNASKPTTGTKMDGQKG